MSNSVDVAVVGVNSAVGEVVVELLEERELAVGKLYLLADEDSAGNRIEYKGGYIGVKPVETFDFSQVQIAIFVAGEMIADQFVPVAAQSGCKVIDNSSRFRMEANIPLVIPEVNGHLLDDSSLQIVASPSSSVIQLLMALKPLHDRATIQRIDVVSCQAVSEVGKKGAEELASQTASLLNMKELKTTVFNKQIAFNVIPEVGQVLENGYTSEEQALVDETCKLLENLDIKVNVTAMWVPVFFSHSQSVQVEMAESFTAQQARELLEQQKGIELVDERNPFDYPTAVSDGAGSDLVYVGRVRESISSNKGLNLWIVSDNVRKGSALNCVQIAENLIKNYVKE